MAEPMLGETAANIVIVTGPAGAGRTTAIRALEDFGFEAIDNMPLPLLQRLLSGPPMDRPLVVGVDMRTRGFSVDAVLDVVAKATQSLDFKPTLLFLDCAVETLLKRFSETRRRHPSAPDDAPRAGIEREIGQMAALRDHADILIDTSDYSPHDLRRELAVWFSEVGDTDPSLEVQSFSYKRGVPRSTDMVIDLRFLRNPYWSEPLRALDGRDPAVADYVRADPLFTVFFDKLLEFTSLLLPAYKAEGKSHFSIGLGCTGGQHRSVFVAQALAKGLAERGWQVSIRHREIERRGKIAASVQG